MRRYSRQLHELRLVRQLRKLQVNSGAERPESPPGKRLRLSLRLTADVKADIVREYRDGIPTTSLCELHSLGKSTILDLLAQAGVELRRRPMTDDQIADARRLYESGLSRGLSLSQVGEQLGIHQATIQRTLWRQGVTLRAPNGWDVVTRQA